MASADGEDPYVRSFTREVNYLRSLLMSLKPVKPPENPDWSQIVEEQQKTLNTLRGDFAIKMSDLEQRLKQNSIRIFGIPENPAENVVDTVRNYFSNRLKLAVLREDIECCYRQGKGGGTRPVVVKFSSDEVRKKVWRRKLALRRNDICEELSPERYKIKQQAGRIFGKECVSVADGKVEIRMPGDSDHDQRERFHTMIQFENFLYEKKIFEK